MKQVVIIGSGIAGLTAAITLAQNGQKSSLVSVMPAERAQSVMAEGGINAALNTKEENDSPQQHYEDTMRAGCDLADPNAVRALTDGAVEIVHWLASLGVAFNRTKSGNLDLRYFGGQKKQRTAFAQSSTGKQIISALIQETRKWEAAGWIERYDHAQVRKIVTDCQNRCTGCIIEDNYTKSCCFLPGNVLLASGGLNTLFGKTTGTTQNTGAATAAAYAAGAACANLEMIQYHPTTTPISGKRALISEAARGEGGRLFVWRNGEKWYYMEEKYPELKNLMPRDVVSRETEQVCRECGVANAWLDMTGIKDVVFKEKLNDLRQFCREFLHLDPKKEFIPVYPGIHYFMGGLYVDAEHHTTLPGLYAAGESACQYHGANRLGGNSLLGAAFGGKQAARSILKDHFSFSAENEEEVLRFYETEWKQIEARTGSVSVRKLEREMAQCMNTSLGIRRCEETMKQGADLLAEMAQLLKSGKDERVSAREQLAFEMRLQLARAMIESARGRKESRGAHCRTDYPERNDELYRKTTLVHCRNGAMEVHFEPIPEEGQPCHIV